MKEITLSDGAMTKVDDEDFEYLSQWKWKHEKRGYAVRTAYGGRVDGKAKSRGVKLHRLVMDAKAGEIVDHINGDKLDNRKSNLRICTQAQNMQNMTKSKFSKSGYKGVHQSRSKWSASIKYNYRKIHLGQYDTAIDAARAYNQAATLYFGDYAKLNKINVD